MEYLKEILSRELFAHKNELQEKAKEGLTEVEVTCAEDPGEISYVLFLSHETLEKGVRDVVKTIFGKETEVFDIFRKGKTIFFTIVT